MIRLLRKQQKKVHTHIQARDPRHHHHRKKYIVNLDKSFFSFDFSQKIRFQFTVRQDI